MNVTHRKLVGLRTNRSLCYIVHYTTQLVQYLNAHTTQASCRLYLLLFSILTHLAAHNLRLIGSQLHNCKHCQTSLRCKHVRFPQTPTYFCGLHRDVGCPCTSCTHFNRIFELMSLLRGNHTLYSGTMPLT